jgi:hypothetical protein
VVVCVSLCYVCLRVCLFVSSCVFLLCGVCCLFGFLCFVIVVFGVGSAFLFSGAV